MNNKVVNSLAIAALIVLVGVMSWRDMHPKVDTQAVSVAFLLTYLAGPDIAPDMIPDDSRPVTIDTGEFSYAADGKITWAPHGMGPTTFAQRQVNLQFDFKSMPHDAAQTVEKINAIAADWVHKGDIINILIFNYSPAQADLKDYAALLHTAHDRFSKVSALGANRYIVFASINLAWGEEGLKALQADSPQFVVNLPQAQIAPALLSQLAALKYNLILQYPAGTQPQDIDMESLKKLNSLTGITLTLDPHKPLPKKEDQIGLFPKF